MVPKNGYKLTQTASVLLAGTTLTSRSKDRSINFPLSRSDSFDSSSGISEFQSTGPSSVTTSLHVCDFFPERKLYFQFWDFLLPDVKSSLSPWSPVHQNVELLKRFQLGLVPWLHLWSMWPLTIEPHSYFFKDLSIWEPNLLSTGLPNSWFSIFQNGILSENLQKS